MQSIDLRQHHRFPRNETKNAVDTEHHSFSDSTALHEKHMTNDVINH